MNLLKRFVSLACVLTMIISLFSVQAASTIGGVTFTVSQTSISQGASTDTVDVTISLAGNNGENGIGGITLYVDIPDGLTLVDKPQKGSALGSLTFTPNGDITSNPYKLVWDGQDGDKTNGDIAVLTFTVPNTTAKEYPISISYNPGDIYDGNMDDITGISIVNGGIKVTKKQIEGVTLSNKTVTYNGEPQGLEPTGLFDGVEVTKVHYGSTDGRYDEYEAPTFAGEYIVNMTVAGEGYADLELKAMLYIKEQKVNITVKDVTVSLCSDDYDWPMPEVTSDCEMFNKEVAENQILIDFSTPDADAAMEANGGKYVPGTYELKAEVSQADIEGRYDVTVKSGKFIIKNDHSATFKPAKAATCTEAGNVAHYYCSSCKTAFEDSACTKEITEPVEIEALGHSMAKYEAKDATCTEDGNVAYYNCATCKKNFEDEDGKTVIANVVIPKAHDFEKIGAVENTCTTDGNVEYYKCNGTCGKNYSDANASNLIENVVVPAAHKLEKVDAVKKTCTTDGNIEYYKCNGTCGKNYTDDKATDVVTDIVIPASHELEKVEAKAKTCTENGNTEYYKCNGECKKLYTTEDAKEETTLEKVTILASHGELVEIPAVPATCKNVGLTAGKKCTVCGVATVVPEAVAKLAHSEETITGQAATCTETGLTDGKKCSVCDATIEEQKEIAALGHNWTEWDTTTDPTKKTRECQNDGCDEKEEYVIDADCEHTETFNVTKTAATCDAAGVDEVYCQACGDLVGEEEVAKLEHNLEEVAEVAATCVAEGNRAHKHCTFCGKNFVGDEVVETVIVPVVDHVWGAADVNGVETCTNGCGATKKVAITTTTPGASVVVEKLDEVLDETDKALIDAGATVVPQISVDEIAENAVSNEIKTQIDSTKTGFASIAVEINVSKKVTLSGGTLEYEVDVEETSALVRIDITLPAELQNKLNYYVARVHNGTPEKITTTANGAGEYIVIDKINHIISLFAKNFSEYAVVGDDYVASTPSVGGGGGVSSPVVKFETNGGSKINSQTVKKGNLATKPDAPTKEGYIFEGWYTDKGLTKVYDFAEKVTKSFTLYAKWTEIEKEPEIEEPDATNAFTDIKESDWFYANVQYVVENKLMNGVGNDKFAPNNTLTRAMLVTVLYRNAGEPTTNRSIPFADVDMGAYYANAVSWAKQNGIVNGVTENEFAPDSNITREQIAAIMFRYAQYKGMDAVTLEENLHFTDADEISEYAVSAMNWAVGTGLMKGKSATTINPKDNATRAEIAAILQRFIEANK